MAQCSCGKETPYSQICIITCTKKAEGSGLPETKVLGATIETRCRSCMRKAAWLDILSDIGVFIGITAAVALGAWLLSGLNLLWWGGAIIVISMFVKLIASCAGAFKRAARDGIIKPAMKNYSSMGGIPLTNLIWISEYGRSVATSDSIPLVKFGEYDNVEMKADYRVLEDTAATVNTTPAAPGAPNAPVIPGTSAPDPLSEALRDAVYRSRAAARVPCLTALPKV